MAVVNPDPHEASVDIVVAEDGSAVIPADRLAELHATPGSKLHVDVRVLSGGRRGLRGSMKNLPALTWEDFERGSRLGRGDLEATFDT